MKQDCTLTIERLIPAPPDKVFDAWVKPDLLARWWGPEGYSVPEKDLDVRPGGAWRTVMKSPEGSNHTVSGVYREIDRPKRLAFTWAWDQDDGSRGHETLVTVDFEAKDGGTLIRLVQETFAEPAQVDNHRIGWSSSFNDLERLFG